MEEGNIMAICPICGKGYTRYNKMTIYCSGWCRIKAGRMKNE